MKLKLAMALAGVSFLLCGCGPVANLVSAFINAATQQKRQVRASSYQPMSLEATRALPVPVIVETDERRDQTEIRERTVALFQAHDYAKLDALAAELRASKAEYLSGKRRLEMVYEGLAAMDGLATDAAWDKRMEELKEWTRQFPESPTPRVALAKVLADYAWRARGGGWANTVSDDGWRLFEKRLEESAQVVAEARKLKTPCPFAYTVAARVALGQGWPKREYERLFRDATQVDPEWLGPYFSKCYYLLPRWHGQAGEWEQFIAAEADKRGGERGDIFYAQIVWRMETDSPLQNVFVEARISWPRVQRGFEAMRKQHPDSLTLTSAYCKLAGLSGQCRLMWGLMEELNGRVDPAAWHSSSTFAQYREWAYRYGKPVAPVVVTPGLQPQRIVLLTNQPALATNQPILALKSTQVASAASQPGASRTGSAAGALPGSRTLQLKDGTVIVGRIQGRINDEILVKTDDGEQLQIKQSELKR